MAHHKAESLVSDQCMFGQPWRKRTRFLCLNVDPFDYHKIVQKCSSKKGICDRTGFMHHRLSGGQKAARAAAFPKALCTNLAAVLISGELAAHYNYSSKLRCRTMPRANTRRDCDLGVGLRSISDAPPESRANSRDCTKTQLSDRNQGPHLREKDR